MKRSLRTNGIESESKGWNKRVAGTFDCRLKTKLTILSLNVTRPGTLQLRRGHQLTGYIWQSERNKRLRWTCTKAGKHKCRKCRKRSYQTHHQRGRRARAISRGKTKKKYAGNENKRTQIWEPWITWIKNKTHQQEASMGALQKREKNITHETKQ